jgi:transcriptional regulator with XRE-family HTH domain
MNQNFSRNIKLLRKRRRKTQDDVSQALNMKRSTLSGYENNVGQPGVESLVAISEYYGVTIDTLVKVDLSALSESQLSQLERGYDVYIKGSNLRVLATTVDNDDNENIELVPEKAKAGYQRGFADPGFISELPVFQLPFLSKEKKYRTFQINGDSMLPVPDGSWVTGEFVQDWFHIKDGEACIILTLNEGIVFKIVENHLEKSGKLIVHSLNPIYKPYEISVKEIKELWKFSHYISQEMPGPEVNNETVLQKLKKLQDEVADIRKKI